MKRIFIIVAMTVMCLQAGAVYYCAGAAWGYAGSSVTGGGNATPTVVKTESELKTALKSSNKVIIIAQNITVSNQISTDKSNLTIMALPGVKLVSTGQSKEASGILYLKGSNIIIRNVTFEGPGAYDCDGKDNLTLDGAKNVWVDHCDFQDGVDGNFDIKGLSDNISVTWCRFRYLKSPKAGGSGGADDHRFSNLVGSSSTDKPADGTYNITYGYCWWDEGCKQRMTRCRNCLIHYLNCYWNSSVADYYVGPENASSYFEGCTFAGNANTAKNIYKGFNSSTNYCMFVNCAGNLPANSGDVSAPAYAYDQLSAGEAKGYVINACGAGATLTVSEQGAVSSACDEGKEPPVIPDPEPVEPGGPVSGDCCVDLSLGTEPTAANKGIPEGFEKLSIIVNLAKGTWDPGYLNMGGNADYITFDFSAYETTIESVAFDVTIPLWTAEKNTISYHWNNGTNVKYTIASAATETVQLTAPANANSFTIQRSASTGTRISKVCFVLKEGAPDPSVDPEPEPEEGLEDVEAQKTARKVLHNGQILILREGKRYNVLGLYQ